MQGSVLGKRSQSSSDSPSCPRDLPTPEATPTAKRIKTTSTSIDLNPDGNKENIPPLPESPSPRRLRRTATENHTSPRSARSRFSTAFCYSLSVSDLCFLVQLPGGISRPPIWRLGHPLPHSLTWCSPLLRLRRHPCWSPSMPAPVPSLGPPRMRCYRCQVAPQNAR